MPGHGAHSCEHEHHDHVGPETGIEYSLYTKIDIDNLECLNEHSDGAGKSVFKPWEDRLKRDKVSYLKARMLSGIQSLQSCQQHILFSFSTLIVMQMKSYFLIFRKFSGRN